MRAPCPMCGSSRHGKIDSQQSFQILASRRCRDCSHVWEPAAPRWLLKIGIVIGLAWVALGAFVTWNGGKLQLRFLWLCTAGVTAIGGCWYRLRGEDESAEPACSDPPGHGLDA